MLLANKLSLERTIRGWTQKRVVSELRPCILISEKRIGQLEQGRAVPSLQEFSAFVKLYDLTSDELLNPIFADQAKIETLNKYLSHHLIVQGNWSFYQKYQVINRQKWIAIPKYDLIIRLYDQYLKNSANDLLDVASFFKNVQFWFDTFEEKTGLACCHDPAASTVESNDPRDPLPLEKVNNEAESLVADIDMFLELYREIHLSALPLAKRIILARTKQGFTLQSLAEQMNVTPRTIQNWETGESIPKLTDCRRLASKLRCSLDYFFLGTNSKVIRTAFVRSPAYNVYQVLNDSPELLNNMAIIDRESYIIFPKKALKEMMRILFFVLKKKDHLTQVELTQTLETTRQFILQWYRLNQLCRKLASHPSFYWLFDLERCFSTTAFQSIDDTLYPSKSAVLLRDTLLNQITINHSLSDQVILANNCDFSNFISTVTSDFKRNGELMTPLDRYH